MNEISRHMIVQSTAFDKPHRAHILLTNKTDEELKAGPMPPESVPECETLPLTKNLDELWRDNDRGRLNLNCGGGDEVTILTGQRNSRNGYNYVGLVHARGDDEIECWNRDGEPESGDPAHKLGSYPEERYGWIAIYKGSVTNHISPSESEAIQDLKRQLGLTTDLDPKDVFVFNICCWVNNDEEERVI